MPTALPPLWDTAVPAPSRPGLSYPLTKDPMSPTHPPSTEQSPPPATPKGPQSIPVCPRAARGRAPPAPPPRCVDPPRSSGSGRSHFHPEPAGTSPDTAPSNLRLLIANSANCQHRSIERNRARAAPCAPMEGRGGGGGSNPSAPVLGGGGGWHPGLRTQPGVSAPPRPPRPHSAAGRDRSCARLTAQSSASAPSRSCSNSPDLGFFPFLFFFVVVVVVAPFFLRRRPAPGLPKKRSGFLIPGLQSCCWRPRGLQRANGSAGRAGGEGADGDGVGGRRNGVGGGWG